MIVPSAAEVQALKEAFDAAAADAFNAMHIANEARDAWYAAQIARKASDDAWGAHVAARKARLESTT
jgi:hypothetical protein